MKVSEVLVLSTTISLVMVIAYGQPECKRLYADTACVVGSILYSTVVMYKSNFVLCTCSA